MQVGPAEVGVEAGALRADVVPREHGPRRIALGGEPLEVFRGEDGRERRAWVSQHTYLFDASIRENLLLADPDARFGNPAELFIVPDHYVFRMLYSQGLALEQLGVPTVDGTPVETDPREIWRTFAGHYHLIQRTPSRIWLDHVFQEVFGFEERLCSANADAYFDRIGAALAQPAFRPRALFERFKMGVL